MAIAKQDGDVGQLGAVLGKRQGDLLLAEL
jgi:hypothetical protein